MTGLSSSPGTTNPRRSKARNWDPPAARRRAGALPSHLVDAAAPLQAPPRETMTLHTCTKHVDLPVSQRLSTHAGDHSAWYMRESTLPESSNVLHSVWLHCGRNRCGTFTCADMPCSYIRRDWMVIWRPQLLGLERQEALRRSVGQYWMGRMEDKDDAVPSYAFVRFVSMRKMTSKAIDMHSGTSYV
eukprot:CAMPEP_0198131326 /NCGR_PEP_ID=MMETSP1442-20131203/55950_1 /TAXON_ID= /ORGANISM="Craspedostauros australis, Strain CCMP3328" /LENGTH=186 /DNA_ID=CAMNT_0043792119 /DNA_START=127 /DNA_END=687 /DNA_ORIENTATION=-